MATLPQEADYGAQVQLRSNRIDLPGQGEMAVADALSRAANTFANMAIEHKNKDDALSYSNAKNEYLIADSQEREKLADDQDFATHDERYRTAMKAHYERLFPTVRSARDQHLFDSEARLMDERGSVAVGDNARTKEIDWNVANVRRFAVEAQGIIFSAKDAQTAQDTMFSVLDGYNAILGRGFLTETEHQNETQTFVTTTAFRRLMTMDPKPREILLERSILMAKTKGEPITREQIAAGEGSGSLADFIPLDDRVAMLEQTKKANEHDETQGAAYAVWDEIRSVHSDPANVGAAVREAGKGLDPDVRSALDVISTRYRQAISAEKVSEREAIVLAGSQMVQDNQNPETMVGDQWGLLHESQKNSLREAYAAKMENREFGKFDVYARPEGKEGMSYEVWMAIPREQKAVVTLESPEWKMSFTPEMWAVLLREQETIQKEIASGKATPRSPGPTPMQRVNGYLVPKGIIPATGRDEADNKLYWATVANLHMALAAAEDLKDGTLTTEEEDLVFAQMMEDEAFTDSYWSADYWPGGPETDPSKKEALGSATPEKLDAMREELTGQTTVHGGQRMTHRMKLETMATNVGVDSPSEYDLSRANFALTRLLGTNGTRYNIHTITDAQMEDVNLEIERRLKGN